jgi:N-acetylmuramoyl-L-alanine amidase
MWAGWVYAIIMIGLGLLFVRELGRIGLLYRKYPRERRGDILFLMTREPGAPFSFLRTIFWDAELDMESAGGRQILRHELEHVRQRHTVDVLLLRIVLVVFWFNPVFYFIYRELRVIHEFEADRCASGAGDRFDYAELLVRQAMHGVVRADLFHSFSSPIKRRIIMITQLSSVVSGRWSRWMAVPMAGLLLCAFSMRREAPVRSMPSAPSVRSKPITVVIDAGHGGADPGAVASNGVREKDIDLALARKVKQLASEYGINVVLTRDDDELAGGGSVKRTSLRYRSELAAAKKADLFISLHTDAGNGADQAGFHIYVSKENPHFQQSARLGGVLIDALKPSYTVSDQLQESKQHIWVLRAASVPAVLILCGNIDNDRDRAFIGDAANQEKVARAILEGITHYHP